MGLSAARLRYHVFEVVFVGDLPEVIRHRTDINLALRNKNHPVIVGLVFEPNLDALGDLRRGVSRS
jgi:hypothetical protein